MPRLCRYCGKWRNNLFKNGQIRNYGINKNCWNYFNYETYMNYLRLQRSYRICRNCRKCEKILQKLCRSRNCKIVQKLQSALHFAWIALDHKIFLEIIFNYSGSWSIIIMNGNDDVGDYDNDEDDDNDLSCMKVVSKWGALLCLICNEQKWSHFDILNLQQGRSSSSLSSFCSLIFSFPQW